LNSNFRLFTRIISRNRDAYALKIATLSIALATSIVLTLFSLNEFGYDQFHKSAANIFRVVEKNVDENYIGNRLSVKIPGDVIRSMSSIRYRDSLIISRVKIMRGVKVVANARYLFDQTIHAVDPTIDQIFSLSIINGDLKNFRENAVRAIVSSDFAEEHWGNSQVADKTLKLFSFGDTLKLPIAAVFRAFPPTSHEKFDILISFDSTTIGILNFNADETGLYGRTLINNPGHYQLPNNHKNKIYTLQAITDIYFGPRMLGEAAEHGDRYSVIILICIASLILFLALTTFINLTTITLPHRSKELAVKKLAGTTRESLLFGFIMESSSLVSISLLISLVILFCIEPFTKSIIGFSITSMIIDVNMTFLLIVAILFCTLTLSPVLMTLRFVEATPNRLLGSDAITFPSLKRYITFVQLGISIFLIVTSVVIRRQINYSLVKEPGQNHDQVVYLNSPSGITNEGVYALRTGWKKNNPNILDVMAISQLPDRVTSKEIGSKFYQLTVDPGFRDFFNLRMEEGHWFGPNSSDSAFVINETAKQNLERVPAEVLGVIEDISGLFNQPEKPIKIKHGSDYGYHWLCVRVLEVDIRRTVQRLAEQFSTNGQSVNINYLNDQFKSWIDYQNRLNRLSGILAIIATVLSCCAVYALSVSLVRDKLKQIAVHRLFGATILHVTVLLIKDFGKQLAIALIIFLPLTYILLHELLRTFVYATRMSWLDPMYAVVYCVVVIVAICTLQAWNLKRMNSTTALKG
jgi:putative ABC transport system permease protein